MRDLQTAIRVLASSGAVFCLPELRGSLCLAAAAAEMSVSVDWVRSNLREFPNAWRLPAHNGNAQHNVGELRIPRVDIAALIERQRVNRELESAACK